VNSTLAAGLFHTFAHAAAPLAVAALWQGAAVAAALAICLRFAPRISAAHRFTVWLAGFAVVTALPILPLITRLLPSADGSSAGAIALPATHAFFQLDDRWTLAIAAIWLALAAFRAAGLALHALRLRRLWRSATPAETELALLHEARTGTAICTTTGLDRPSVIGFFAPRILIPDWLLGKLTREELQQVVLHESEHLRRRDDWTNLLQKLCLVLFPLNPALAWMDRRLAREREMACDEGVIRATGAPRAYAACLASLAERGLENRAFPRHADALSLGAFERRSEVVQRVHTILFGKRLLNPAAARALLGAVGCGLLFGAVELARSPQLVAFVPAPAAQLAAAAPQFAETAIPGYRAINTLAVMPQSPQRTLYRKPAAAYARATQAARQTAGQIAGPAAASVIADSAIAASQASSQTSSQTASQQLIKAEAADLLAAAQPAPQQWIVLTSWRQVEPPAAKTGRVADYDTGTAPEDSAADRPAKQVTVTRLILRVYPASEIASASSTPASGKPASPAAGANADSTSNPKHFLDLPAVPFGDGWLVIQL
jgi:beta-lactamase regulating signal transducer with metallopeptidase domain